MNKSKVAHFLLAHPVDLLAKRQRPPLSMQHLLDHRG